jgi:hypothetical protein
MQIDKGIPIPKKGLNTQLTALIPEMEISDSILAESRSQVSSIQSVARRLGFSTIVRKQKDGKYRLWRIRPEDAFHIKNNGKHKEKL